MPFRSLLTLRLMAAATVASCSSSEAPAPPTVVTYDLISINGVSLPTLDPAQPEEPTIAGGIRLVGNDSAHVWQSLGSAPVIAIQVGDDSVSRSGTTLVLYPYQFGIGVDTATLSGNQLIVRHHLRAGSVAEQFLYVAQ